MFQIICKTPWSVSFFLPIPPVLSRNKIELPPDEDLESVSMKSNASHIFIISPENITIRYRSSFLTSSFLIDKLDLSIYQSINLSICHKEVITSYIRILTYEQGGNIVYIIYTCVHSLLQSTRDVVYMSSEWQYTSPLFSSTFLQFVNRLDA